MNHKIRCISIFCVYRGTYTQVYKLVYRELKSTKRYIYISIYVIFTKLQFSKTKIFEQKERKE